MVLIYFYFILVFVIVQKQIQLFLFCFLLLFWRFGLTCVFSRFSCGFSRTIIGTVVIIVAIVVL